MLLVASAILLGSCQTNDNGNVLIYFDLYFHILSSLSLYPLRFVRYGYPVIHPLFAGKEKKRIAKIIRKIYSPDIDSIFFPPILLCLIWFSFSDSPQYCFASLNPPPPPFRFESFYE